MGVYVEGFKESFIKSLNPLLWLYYLIIIVVAIIINFIVNIVTFDVPVRMLLEPYTGDVSKILSDLALIIVVLVLFYILYLIISGIINTYVNSAFLKIAKSTLENKPADLEESIKTPFDRIAAFFFANLITFFFFFILIIVLGIVLLLSPIQAIMQSLSIQSLATADPALMSLFSNLLNRLNVMLTILVIVYLLLLPVLFLIGPSAVFGRGNAIDSIKTAWVLAKKNYLLNLLYSLVYIILIIVAILAFALFCIFLYFISKTFILLAIVLLIPFAGWFLSFTNLIEMNLYLINSKK